MMSNYAVSLHAISSKTESCRRGDHHHRQLLLSWRRMPWWRVQHCNAVARRHRPGRVAGSGGRQGGAGGAWAPPHVRPRLPPRRPGGHRVGPAPPPALSSPPRRPPGCARRLTIPPFPPPPLLRRKLMTTGRPEAWVDDFAAGSRAAAAAASPVAGFVVREHVLPAPAH